MVTSLRPLVLAGLVAAVVGLRSPAVAQPPVAAAPAADDAADLALVPADAAGFVHVRLADVWKNDLMAGVRKTWERAGAKALAALDDQFVPAPSTLDRVTGFVLLDPERGQPLPFAVVRFSAPFDPALVVASYLPKAELGTVGRRAVYTDKQLGLAVTFPDNRHVLIGMAGALEGYMARKPAADGPLAPALKLARTRAVVGAANVAALPIPPGALAELPEAVRPVLKARQLLVAMELGAEARIEVRATYADDAAAADAEAAVRALVALGRQELAKQVKELEARLFDPKAKTPRPADELPEAVAAVFGLGAMGRLDDLLADAKLITRDGTALTFAASVPKEVALLGGLAPVGVGLLLPAVQKVREAAARTQSANNLKQIGLAVHNYESAYGKLPEDIKDKDGKPLLSWRVAILPYIEQEAVYKQFKLDEPWDSEHNAKLSALAVKVFESPNAPDVGPRDGYAVTHYRGVAGPGTVFDPKGKVTFPQITDGTSNTIMVVETADPIPWAKPGDYLVEANKPLPKLVPPAAGGVVNVLMADGSVRAVNPARVSEKTWRILFGRNDGLVTPADWE